MITSLKNIFYNLHSHHKSEHTTLIAPKAKRRIIYRVFLYLPTVIKLQKLYKNYDLAFVLQKDINHYNKAYYPLLNKNIDNSSKLKYLEEHFKTISTFKPVYKYLLYTQSIMLLDMSKYDIDVNLKIQYDHFSRHEGELTFYLEDRNTQHKIFKMTGLINSHQFYIGGVQGQTTKDVIRNLTKECFGMRPHNFLLYCLMEFVKVLGCKEVYGIKNIFHVSNARKRTRGLISFDYDKFWQELNPIRETPFWYVLSSNYELRNLSEVKSNKRSMYKKRYNLLTDISSDLVKKTYLLFE